MNYPSIWFKWNGMREKNTKQNKTSKLKEMKKVEQKRSEKRETNLSLEAQLVVFLCLAWIKGERDEKSNEESKLNEDIK